jgi:hypothetical protein
MNSAIQMEPVNGYLPIPMDDEFTIVDQNTFRKYRKKYEEIKKKRCNKAIRGIVFTVFTTLLFYLDIALDIYHCVKHYQNNDIGWLLISLTIIITSLLLNMIVLFYSHFNEIKKKLKLKDFKFIFCRVICFIFPLELFYW